MGQFNLFIKMLREEYPLSEQQVEVLRRRLLADDQEFASVWKQYKSKAKRTRGGVDEFKFLLQDLLN